MIAFDLRTEYRGFRLAAKAASAGEIVALFGRSGAGKSTILEALAGVRPEVEGTITLRNERIDVLPPSRRGMGWVPQDAALFPHLSARGNAYFAARTEKGRRAVDAAVEALLLAPILGRRSSDLSGGERQRVALARALGSVPRLLVLDEPLASVDRPLRNRMAAFLKAVPRDFGAAVLFVTHDPHEVLALADHLVILDAGSVVASGAPRDVLASPLVLGVLEALGAENLFRVRPVGERDGIVSLVTEAGCPLEVAAVPGFAPPERVAIRSEDILLSGVRPERISAQNLLEGRIVRVETLAQHVFVSVVASGETFLAKVTPRAVLALSLGVDHRIWLLMKAHSIHPVP